MMNINTHREMIQQVADALGPALCKQMAFVGGCTTGLMLTDDFTKEQVRHTDDVDLIIHVVNYPSYLTLKQELSERGFKEVLEHNDPICAMRLGELRVDFMPDNEDILSFGNCWYQMAWETADDYLITEETSIRLVKPVYFVATKLQAYLGRGNNDPLASRDIEDLLNIFDGRREITNEILDASPELLEFIAKQISALLDDASFVYAVQSASLNDSGREELIYKRLEQIAKVSE